jgi:hypothetical protein
MVGVLTAYLLGVAIQNLVTTANLGCKTVRIGLTVGLSLGAIVGLAGCSEQTGGEETDSLAGIQSENGLSMNGLSMNGLSMNGLSMNGLSMNGLSMNGLSMNGLSMNGLSTTSGLMTTNGGREITKYMVKCALPSGHQYATQDQNGYPYTYQGSLGVAPEWETGTCGKDCQERLSACLLAHVNNAGVHISLWLDGEGAVGWGTSTDFPYMEGAFFGNLITNQNSNNVAGGWQGWYCNGAQYDQGAVPGRLGAALTSTVYQNWYGGGVLCTTGGSGYKCNLHSDGSGFDNCTIKPNNILATYNHVVTVWRNFEQGMPYKICSVANICLTASSSSGGSAVNAASYTGSTMQQWYVTQVSPGKYKLINVATGDSLDVSSGKAVQTSYTGSSTQQLQIKVLGQNNAGKFALVPTSGTCGYDGGWSAGQATIPSSCSSDASTWANSAWWMLTGIPGNLSFDPSYVYRLRTMISTNSSVDVAYANTADGTFVQQYTSWDGDPQKFNILASGSNWKITMGINNAKCIGPVGNGTGNGTQMEVQDCVAGSANQAWSATSDGTTGSTIFKNVASGRCLDVTGNTSANGARMQLWDCSGQNNQKYSAE